MIIVLKEGKVLEKTNRFLENRVVLLCGDQKGRNVPLYYCPMEQWNRSILGNCSLDGPTEVSERWVRTIMVPEIYKDFAGHI